MEIRGIEISGAGTSLVNGRYFISNMLMSGTKREWKFVNTTDGVTVFLRYITVPEDDTPTTQNRWALVSFDDNDNMIIYYTYVPSNNAPCKEPTTYVDAEGNTITDGQWTVDPLSNPVMIAQQQTGTITANRRPILRWITDKDISQETEDATTEYDEETKESTVTRVTTYTNSRDNSVVKTTDIIKETVKNYESKVVEWQSTPTIAIGKVYRFSFIREFKELGYIRGVDTDPNKGIYKVTEICTLYDLLKSGIDLYENLYAPLGLSKELYKFDLENINGSVLYKLLSLEDPAKFYYMPMSFFDGNPDGSIEEYKRLMFVMDLGYFADVNIVADLIEIGRNLLIAKYGIDDTENADPCQIITADSAYMHYETYELLDKRRQQLKESTKAAACSTLLLSKLFNSEFNALQKRNDDLSKQCTAYEDIITGNITE